MGISHDYHSTGRSRRGGPGGVIRFAGAVAGILLVSFAITAIPVSYTHLTLPTKLEV